MYSTRVRPVREHVYERKLGNERYLPYDIIYERKLP